MLSSGGLTSRATASLRHLAPRTVFASGTKLLKEYDSTEPNSLSHQALSRQQSLQRASRAFRVVAEKDSIDVRFNRPAQVGKHDETDVPCSPEFHLGNRVREFSKV